MRQTNSQAKKNLVEIAKFALIGVANTLIDFLMFFVLFNLVGVNKNVAQICSMSIAMVHSYLWNRYWTFRKTGGVRIQEIWKFIVVNLVALGVTVLCLNLFYDLWHLERLAQWGLEVLRIPFVLTDKLGVFFCKILAVPFSLAVNYVGNRIWVFQKK